MNDPFENVELLLVEDNEHDAEMTMRALKKGRLLNKLFWVRDGVEALDFVHCTGSFASRDPSRLPKLVLLDLKMPRLNGIDVLRELKSHAATSAIPVVIMTSSDRDRDIAESYSLGVNGYVTKPVQLASFMETVAQIGMYWLLTNQSPIQ
ncbi:MAG: response regulator [Vulcanimicrobiaceae bacterium]